MANNWSWDKWQRDLIDYKGSITVRAGRQTGKSTAVSKRIVDQMLEYAGTERLIIAPSQRQSSELFLKVRGWLESKHQEVLQAAGGFKPNPAASHRSNLILRRQFEYDHGIYNEIPTKTTIILKKDFRKPQHRLNEGSKCYSLPAGKTGMYLRTFALDFLDCDEAAYIPEPVYTAVKPMLAVSEKAKGLGWETFLSTPYGRGGFFYKSHFSTDYRQYHVSAEDCSRISRSFLAKEKARLTKAEYMQEWLGEFTDEWNQFFPTELIKRCMTFMEWSLERDRDTDARYYLGVDIARYGGDENAFVVAEMKDTNIKIVKVFTTDRVSTTDTIGRIEAVDAKFGFRKIFIDDAGIGGGVTDSLQDKLGKRRVVGLNNARKRIQMQGEERKVGIFKEDLYSNALMLMETGKLTLINHLGLLKSLKSITYEYGTTRTSRKIKIFGDYSHITEAMVRACWCLKEKGLDLYIY